MLDRPERGERCLLFHIGVGRSSYEDELEEFRALANSAGAEIVAEVKAQLARPNARYFAGPGKVLEVAEKASEVCADLVLVSHPSEAQARSATSNSFSRRGYWTETV